MVTNMHMKKKKGRAFFILAECLFLTTALLAAGVAVLQSLDWNGYWKRDRIRDIGFYIQNGRWDLPVSEDGYYEIYHVEDYELFMEVIAPIEGWQARGRLMEDIYMNNPPGADGWEYWHVAPWDRSPFLGILDGNGHTIYGVYSSHGFGVVWENYGTIRNLTVVGAFVAGSWQVGGICKWNYGTIEQCSFQGVLNCSKDENGVGNMAGICIRNETGGRIDRCRYLGEVRVEGRTVGKEDGGRIDFAGICYENSGKITNCCNLTRNTTGKAGYAIADCGVETCYTGKGGGWEAGWNNECIELEESRIPYAPLYMEKDWYRLYRVQQKEGKLWVPQGSGKADFLPKPWTDGTAGEGGKAEEEEWDMIRETMKNRFISDIIPKILYYRQMDVTELTVQAETAEGDCLFALRLGDGTGEEMVIAGYPMEESVFRDYDRLWQACAGFLGVGAEEEWEHRTWGLLYGEEPGMCSGKMIFFQYKGQEGVFYMTPDGAYRITFNGIYRNVFRRMSEYVSDKDGYFGGEADAWNGKAVKGGNLHFWQILLEALCRDAVIGDGLWWNGDEKAMAYLCMGWEEDDPVAVEDVRAIDVLRCDLFQLENLDFLEYMPGLTRLSAGGCGLKDISGLEKAGNLVYLNLEKNKITDISPLQGLERLEEVNLSGNPIEDYSPLYGKGLYGLTLQNGITQELGDLYFVPWLSVDSGMTWKEWLRWKAEAEERLGEVYGDTEFAIKDITTGDVDGDGNLDMAVMVSTDGWTHDRLELLFGSESEERLSLEIAEPEELEGDCEEFQIMILGGRLMLRRVYYWETGQPYASEWHAIHHTIFYEWDGSGLIERWETKRIWREQKDEIGWSVYDCGEGIRRDYIIREIEDGRREMYWKFPGLLPPA